jgi:hypothetical protein
MDILRRDAACGWQMRDLVETFARTLKVDELRN